MALRDLAGDGCFLFNFGSNCIADFVITLSSEGVSRILAGSLGGGDGDLHFNLLERLDFDPLWRCAMDFGAIFLRPARGVGKRGDKARATGRWSTWLGILVRLGSVVAVHGDLAHRVSTGSDMMRFGSLVPCGDGCWGNCGTDRKRLVS